MALIIGFSIGIGSAIGPVFTGYVYDVVGSYSIPFIVCGVAAAISALLILFVKPLPETEFVPAPAQGMLGIQCRAEGDWSRHLAKLDCPAEGRAVAAEREILEKLEGGCQLPFGINIRPDGDAELGDAGRERRPYQAETRNSDEIDGEVDRQTGRRRKSDPDSDARRQTKKPRCRSGQKTVNPG